MAPTINYTTPDPECDLDYVPNVGSKADIELPYLIHLGLSGQMLLLF